MWRNLTTTSHKKWSDEVHGIRSVRDRIRSGELNEEIMAPAIRIENKLSSKGLDPRSIDSNGIRKDNINTHVKGILGLMLMLLMAPLSLATLPQALLAWWLGNNSDEGLDARSTFHILAITFSPILIWPFFTIPLAVFIAITFTPENVYIASIAMSILFIPIIHIANLIFLVGYDAVCDSQSSIIRSRMRNSNEYQLITEDITLILGLLK